MEEIILQNLVHNRSNTKLIDEAAQYYLSRLMKQYDAMQFGELKRNLISEFNYEKRKEMKSSELVGFKVRIGDICYLDFGKAYINEAGFQHFGVIISINNSKAFVVPMTSNASMYDQSYCSKTYTCGKKHLMRLGDIEGLNKKSVLFLNDAKYINTARIIEIKGYIDPKSELFYEIKQRLKECLNIE